MKFVQKIFATFLVLGVLASMGSFVLYFAARHDVPYTQEATAGDAADSFARMVQDQVKSKSWTYVGAIKWSIFNRDYLWDLQRGLVRVKWAEDRVLFDVDRKREVAYSNKKKLNGKESKQLVDQAYQTWKKDLFILDPTHTLFNKGVVRYLIHAGEQDESLFVTYTEQGQTLDSFQWFVNEDGRPSHVIMWSNDFFLQGVEVHFSNWVTITEGLMISTERHVGPLTIEIKNLKSSFSLAELIGHKDPFTEVMPDPFEPPPTSQPNQANFPDTPNGEAQMEFQ